MGAGRKSLKICVLVLLFQYMAAHSVDLLKVGSNSTDFRSSNVLFSSLNTLFRLQVDHWSQIWTHRSTALEIIIFQPHLWHLASSFQRVVSKLRPPTFFICVCLNQHDDEMNVVVRTLKKHYNNTHSVVLFIEDSQWLERTIEFVCSTTSFRWTILRHMTEWIVVSRNANFLSEIETGSLCVDFITLLVEINEEVFVARKSRGVYNSSLQDMLRIGADNSTSLNMLKIRFKDLAKTRKSSLEGLHMPIAVFIGPKRYASDRQKGNTTILDGYAITLAEVLASYMGFTYNFVMPEDRGAYGSVEIDGTVTGITGLLVRREAALSTMNTAKTESRLKIIDYTDCPSSHNPIYITYKLPTADALIDTTLVGIVHADFFLYLIGPLFAMLIIGGLTHISTNSCSDLAPEFSTHSLRQLHSFPDHVCFQNQSSYAGQTGRILKASWGVFWLIMSAGYSAYLVTTFTVKEPELTLNSLEKLLHLSSTFRFGTPSYSSALISQLQTTKDEKLRQLWQRMLAYNRSDPRTMSSDPTEHILQVLAGNYAMITFINTDVIPLFFNSTTLYDNGDLNDIRSYRIHSLYDLNNGFVTFPQNAFYKDELNAAILKMEASGVLSFLRNMYLQQSSRPSRLAISRHKSVPLSRILLPLFITLGGIAVGGICLVAELLHVWCKRRLSHKKVFWLE